VNVKLKGKHSRGRPRPRCEQQVKKYVMQKDGRAWEEIEKGKRSWTD
jgi:hypothetical protein